MRNMKKQFIIAVAAFGLTLGAFAQAAFIPNLSDANNLGYGFVEVYGQTSGYTGIFGYSYFGVDVIGNESVPPGDMGFQLWWLNGTGSPTKAAINNLSLNGHGAAAYAALTTDGYTLLGTYTGQNVQFSPWMLNNGDDINIPGVRPAGGRIELAVVGWTGDSLAFGSAGANDGGYSAYGGVYVWDQTTVNYNIRPEPTPPFMQMDGDLVLSPVTVPEPATFALVGLGAAALLIFRRRK